MTVLAWLALAYVFVGLMFTYGVVYASKPGTVGRYNPPELAFGLFLAVFLYPALIGGAISMFDDQIEDLHDR